jgi:hypothetical protein
VSLGSSGSPEDPVAKLLDSVGFLITTRVLDCPKAVGDGGMIIVLSLELNVVKCGV